MQIKNFFDKMFSRIVLTVLLIVVQLLLMFTVIYTLSSYYLPIALCFVALSILITLFIIRLDESSSYKLTWVVIILAAPVFGGLLYLYLGNKRPMKRMRKKMDKEHSRLGVVLKQDKEVLEQMEPRLRETSRYLAKYSGCPVRMNSETEYFTCGEELYPVLLRELEKAERYIFAEFFIIAPGVFWDSVLEILKRKAAEGVDVKLIYDDWGCMSNLPANFPKKLAEYGIKTLKFNPFIPVVSVIMNHRDHRKIIVIDGKTAFTGGFNLADEYINKKERFGYWKDSAVMIKGDGVLNFTALFAEMWNSFSEERIDCEMCAAADYGNVKPCGFIQPFGDSPLDNEQVSENVYLEIINQARDYVYIFTPYLVIDDQMRVALSLAAKRGVDVRIVTPGVPDKKTVFRVTRSYYQTLISSGVRIYEFTPGFIHAKSFVCDDRMAVVGSINMDFRSLYLHFECGVYMASEKGGEISAIMKLKQDCLDTFEKSHEVKRRESRKFSNSIFDAVLRVLGPLI